jgi:hypothetical protein
MAGLAPAIALIVAVIVALGTRRFACLASRSNASGGGIGRAVLSVQHSHRQHQEQKKQRDDHRRHDPIGQAKLRQSALLRFGGSARCPQSPIAAVEKPVMAEPTLGPCE